MTKCWQLNLNNNVAEQNNEQLSFIGGYPRLPSKVNIPSCDLCGQQQSFMLQVAFPEGHKWSELSLAIFACTSCVDEDHLIPEMLPGPLHGVDIPNGFLESYQKNFRFIVFETNSAVVKEDYGERVRYKPLELQFSNDPNVSGSKIGGSPSWLLEDESPGKYDNLYNMCFLLQITQGFEFEIVADALPQMELDLMGSPTPSPYTFYQLFNGNEIYLFGVEKRNVPLVYAITQT